MKWKAAQAGLDWQVDSAGTGYWHTGELPDKRSMQVARAHGIDISDQRARQFQQLDFDRFDKIFVMDTQNLRNVLRMARTEEESAKVELILNQAFPGEDRSVPDPYFDDDGFEAVFQMLEAACTAYIQQQQ